MSATKRVAVVTGSNKGIGYEIVKGLAKTFEGIVYLTARNEDLGHESLKTLKQEGLNVSFHQLEIDNDESVNRFAQYIKETHGGLDVLVNNAAIGVSENLAESPNLKLIEDTIRINYFGTLKISNALFPLLKSNGKVINVASRLGLLSQLTNESLKQKYSDERATIEDISNLMDQYIQSRKDNSYESLGYKKTNMLSYNVSKIGLNAITRIQQRIIDKDNTRSGISVNSMCPGYCKTDMTKGGGFLTAEQGAQTAIYLSSLPSDHPGTKGGFWAENKAIDWINDPYTY